MFKRRLFLQASTSGVGVKKIYEDKGKEDGINGSIMSKILPHFVKRKFSLTPMKKHLIIPNQLEYLESIVQLVREKKCWGSTISGGCCHTYNHYQKVLHQQNES